MNRRIKISFIAAIALSSVLGILLSKKWIYITSWYQGKIYDNSIRNRLPISDAQEIEILTITSIYTLRGLHLYANIPVCVSVGSGKLSKKQLDFLREIHPPTYTYDNCPNDTLSKWSQNVRIMIWGAKKLKSDSVTVQWNYHCGSTCGLTGEFQLSKFNKIWMITRYKPGAVS